MFRKTDIREVFLKDGEVLKFESNLSSLIYGKPTIEEKETSDWKDLLSILNYSEDFEGYKTRRGRVWCHVDYRDKNFNCYDTRVYQDNFLRVTTTEKIRFADLDRIRMDDLTRQLKIEEFIQFLKDNDVNYVAKL